MKPDWKDAPEWANYVAMDSDGVWWWYRDEPYQEGEFWTIYTAQNEGTEPVDLINWRDSLEQRP